MNPAEWARSYVRLCASLDPFWAISAMTLVAMVRYEQGAWFYSILNAVLLSLACLFPQVVRREQFWLAVCLVGGSSIILNWYLHGNHIYLQFYWTLALLISCFARNQMRVLALSARWLVGGVFLFAFIWKLVSADFQSGATMRYLMSATLPLGQSAVVLTELTGPQLAENMAAVERVIAAPGAASTSIIVPPGLGMLADILTRATWVMEGWMALVFLSPLSTRWRRLREASLLVFFVTAYTLLPVAAFATQLAYLGYALTRSDRYRAAFIAAYFAYQLADLGLGRVWSPT